jgi:hypothetical protein
MKELLNKLKAPVPYQWRVQSRTKDKSKAICTAYIDARDVMNILDEHCEEWQSRFDTINGFIFAGIGIKINGDYIWRWDCGNRIEDDKTDQMYEQAGKSAASDAFKRAAVMWGIGRFLYDLPSVTLNCDDKGNVVDSTGKKVWDLTKHINDMQKAATKPAAKTNVANATAAAESQVLLLHHLLMMARRKKSRRRSYYHSSMMPW